MRAREHAHSNTNTHVTQPWSTRARARGRVIALDARGEETLAGIPDMEVSRMEKR